MNFNNDFKKIYKIKMGCCGSSDGKRSKGHRVDERYDSPPNRRGGYDTNHEEIAQRRMEYYNRDEVKKKQIIRNYD